MALIKAYGYELLRSYSPPAESDSLELSIVNDDFTNTNYQSNDELKKMALLAILAKMRSDSFRYWISGLYPESMPSFYGNIGAVLVIISWILLIVWKKIRTYIKTPIIGLLAGINIYLPLSLLLTKAWNISLMPIVSTILYLIIISVVIALEIIVFAPRLNRSKE